MSPMVACPVLLVRLMGIMGLLLTVCAVFTLVEACILHVGTKRIASLALQAVALVELTRTCAVAMREPVQALSQQDLTTPLLRAPVLLVAVLYVLLGWMVLTGFLRLRALRRNHITPDSVKDALDALPDGVCFSALDGTPLLVNARMDMLAHDAFDSPVKDATAIWRLLVAGDCRAGYEVELASSQGVESVEAGDSRDEASVHPTLLAPDGKAWQFSRGALAVDGRQAVETIAADVTEEHALLRQLEDRNERLEHVNEQLRAYGRDVARLTREEELLAAKVRVHDEVGRALVALRVYERQDQDERDRDGLLRLWRGIKVMLQTANQEEPPMDDWELLCQAAEAIDVRLQLEGELPDGPERSLVIALVHECLNNAVRHGEAHEVLVQTIRREGAWQVDVTNDGAVPETPVGLQGGLKNIRTAVERSGGTLDVAWTPRVTVTARLTQGS